MPFKLYCYLLRFCIFLLLNSCTNSSNKNIDDTIPTIGFIDYVEDETLAQARKGFFDALYKQGFSETEKTINVIYKNAQGDQPTLLQATDYIVSKSPVLIATNTTLATVTAVQRNKTIPVFMMVSPRPDIAKLTDKNGNAPANLFGVYETLDYIDTSVTLIKKLFPFAKRVGTIYSQSESQSVDALNRLKNGCNKLGIEIIEMPVTNSSETQLITESLLSKNIDVFFALPDNVIFSSFETIAKSCNDKNVPIITSESGLVKRGALASYGADMYWWGFQAGEQAAKFLKEKSTSNIKPEIVSDRRRIFNTKVAKTFNLTPDSTFLESK
jgi:putative ABC transport system substrate-binding protein